MLKQNTFFRRLLAISLAVIMAMSAAPMTAFAEENPAYDLTAIITSIESSTNSGTGWSHANNIITFSEAGAITISGTASGYSVVVSNSTNITLAAGTSITGKNQYAALTVPGGATITGGGASVNITGGTSNHDTTLGNAIQSNGAITLAGEFGAITDRKSTRLNSSH